MALWDLEAQHAATPAARALESAREPASMVTALTISLDAPAAMAEAARALAGWPLIKIKVDASDPASQIHRVREACPSSTLIVDPNESWNLEILRELEPALLECRVALLEQPLPAQSEELQDQQAQHSRIPICADESCHTAADLPQLAGRFQLIKVDKTGGLTAALALLDRRLDFGIMTGCMICTSLSIAPALNVARRGSFVDLDGPLWLLADRSGGVRNEDGHLCGPRPGFWASPARRALGDEIRIG